MTFSEPYSTPTGVESAIREAARNASRQDHSLGTDMRIRLEYFNRFLSRIFSEAEGSDWVLKGGAGILARIPSTRSTRDIDLYRPGFTLEQAVEDLKRLARLDLQDHFRFEYISHETAIGAETQPYTEGCRVTFNIFIGPAKRGSLQIDLAIGLGLTDDVTVCLPATALPIPRLVSNPYRLYPIVDQLADKVCATMTDFDGRASSREKDLVDIIVFAVTQDIDGTALNDAIEIERRRRKMAPLETFRVPTTWGRGYSIQRRSVPHCDNYPTVDQAAELAARLIGPALTAESRGQTWSAELLDWH
ncbi:nucleotidyl transferase AbiEii/AbiGii toxin family protein [Nesterenkonia marinintestina]|uniref:nucleotidyl transferase AbiEii/AbiGii toxin family protein n=1 Tax=Nesterenkonia marinintestina TaxID=2979865 RepID=UPI0021C16C29|nr:nucleotidyl transferase AbiEii/AbiGii toxin family protein [Nesterenkonia sp. GX14115]